MRGERGIVLDVISSQTADHAQFGGVVPELASRKHQEAIIPLLDALLREAGASRDDIGLIAVTCGPGLMGSLLVGVMTAKALAQAWGKPLIGVDHLEGHLYANMAAHEDLAPPMLCLIVSGGHTEMIHMRAPGDHVMLGTTRDDAAGEAYDKAAKILGMAYPGGPEIERAAAGGDASAWSFPIGLKGTGRVEFSFSGMKTSFRSEVERIRQSGGELPVADLCASFQRCVTDSLLHKVELAVKQSGVRRVAISGGVAANADLRERLSELGRRKKFEVWLPPKEFCTDNAVMIACAGYAAYARGERSGLDMSADPAHEIWSEPARS